MGRQAVGAMLFPGPFDLSPGLCYPQRPLCAASIVNTVVESIECGFPLGQNFVIAVCPYGGCNQKQKFMIYC